LQIVEQYQAVSYGDPLFSTFILLPTTNANPWKFRFASDQEFYEFSQK
jgi:hypothetical protein